MEIASSVFPFDTNSRTLLNVAANFLFLLSSYKLVIKYLGVSFTSTKTKLGKLLAKVMASGIIEYVSMCDDINLNSDS